MYNYYKKGNKIIIRVEAPGNTDLKTDVKYSESFIVIEIQGKKRKDNEPKYLEENLFNSREFGEFLISIPLNAKDNNLKNKSPEINKKQGIIMIEYELYELNEKKTQNAIYICKEEV